MRLYENISSEMNQKINEKLNKLESEMFLKMTTARERQYMFLTFLQGLPLIEKRVREIYTSTNLK